MEKSDKTEATEICICGAALEDGECRSDHHMDFAVEEDETS